MGAGWEQDGSRMGAGVCLVILFKKSLIVVIALLHGHIFHWSWVGLFCIHVI